MSIKKIGLLVLFIGFTVASGYGQAVDKEKTAMIPISKKAFAAFKIGDSPNNTSFKIKFPGTPTVNVIGNSLNEKALTNLYNTEIGAVVQIFHIKRGASGKEEKPMIFKLTKTTSSKKTSL